MSRPVKKRGLVTRTRSHRTIRGAITILLADGHQVVRAGIRRLLEGHGFRVVGETSSGLEIASLGERLKPQVAVIELWMSDLNGVDASRILRARSPHTEALVLTASSREAHVVAALRAGIRGYIAKDATERELVRGIRRVAAGHVFLSARFAHLSTDGWLRKAKEAPAERHERLTLREQEVLHLAGDGHSSQEIAQRLGISRRTVEEHRERVKQKLGLRNQTQLVRYVVERGLLPPYSAGTLAP